MKKILLFLGLLTNVLIIPHTFGASTPSFPADIIRDSIIDAKKVSYDLILLDIRRADEVVQGIIASENCKPYHLIWGDPEWDAHYKDLPKDIPIIIYCRSGSRANSAITALKAEGYTMIATMKDGINAYNGTLADSSNFKPWSSLPSPSYTGISSVNRIVPYTRSTPARSTTIDQSRKPEKLQSYNLRGQKLPSTIADPNAPVFVLEKIGDTRRTRVTGIQHLIQRERD